MSGQSVLDSHSPQAEGYGGTISFTEGAKAPFRVGESLRQQWDQTGLARKGTARGKCLRAGLSVGVEAPSP